jgi:hypothetical protein
VRRKVRWTLGTLVRLLGIEDRKQPLWTGVGDNKVFSSLARTWSTSERELAHPVDRPDADRSTVVATGQPSSAV